MTVTVFAEVEVDLSEINTEDLIAELEYRDYYAMDQKKLLEKIWLLRRDKRSYQTELDELIYNTIGKIA